MMDVITKPPILDSTGKRIYNAITYNGLLDTSWATASDERIVELVQAADSGALDLEVDLGWATGDRRTVTLTDNTTTDLILTNPKGYQLDQTSTTGSRCNFAIIPSEVLLVSHYYYSDGQRHTYSSLYDYMVYDDTSTGMMGQVLKYLNGDNYYGKFPDYIKTILKKFGVYFIIDKDLRGDIGGGWRYNCYVQTISLIEMFGEEAPSNAGFVNKAMELQNMNQIDYFKSETNRRSFLLPDGDDTASYIFGFRSFGRHSDSGGSTANNYSTTMGLQWNKVNQSLATRYDQYTGTALFQGTCPLMCI